MQVIKNQEIISKERKSKERLQSIIFHNLETNEIITSSSLMQLSKIPKIKNIISYYNLKKLFINQNIKPLPKISIIMKYFDERFKIYINKEIEEDEHIELDKISQ